MAMSIHWLALWLTIATPVCSHQSQVAPTAASNANKSQGGLQALSEIDQARLNYYTEVKEYVLRYAQTPASCSEIVEAALATYEDDCHKIPRLLDGAKKLTWQELEDSAEKLREATRRWAMKVALEAKYPDPSIFKTSDQSAPSAQVPKGASNSKTKRKTNP